LTQFTTAALPCRLRRTFCTDIVSGVCTNVKYKLDKKLSSCRETARCFMSLNVSLNHSRSLKVIRNDTLE